MLDNDLPVVVTGVGTRPHDTGNACFMAAEGSGSGHQVTLDLNGFHPEVMA